MQVWNFLGSLLVWPRRTAPVIGISKKNFIKDVDCVKHQLHWRTSKSADSLCRTRMSLLLEPTELLASRLWVFGKNSDVGVGYLESLARTFPHTGHSENGNRGTQECIVRVAQSISV